MEAIPLILTTYHTAVHSKTWIRVYIVNSGCDSSSCCCISDQIVLNNASSTISSINTGLNGALYSGSTYFSNQVNFPTGYTATSTISGLTLTIALSGDRNTLTIIRSLGSQCGLTAVRQGSTVLTTTVHSDIVQQ